MLLIEPKCPYMAKTNASSLVMPKVTIGTPSKTFNEEHFPFGLIGYGGCQGLFKDFWYAPP